MSVFVGIMSCHKLDYFIDDLTVDWCTQQGLRCTDQQARVNTIRATWVKDLPADVDYRIFYGTRLRQDSNRRNPKSIPLRAPLADEIFLDCGDQYTANPDKMKAMCRWVLANTTCTHLLRCDDDTFIYPARLFTQDRPLWEGKDYAGASASNFHPGGCVFLSRRMMELVISEHITTYADDVWMGQIAESHRIPMTTIPTMRNQWGTGYKVPIDIDPTGISSFHSCTPDVMRRLHVTGKV
jgi:hypothetical protein